jgi:hypothetical protein
VACSKESELKKNVLLVSELEKLLFLFWILQNTCGWNKNT